MSDFDSQRRYNDSVTFGALRIGMKLALKAGSLAGLFV